MYGDDPAKNTVCTPYIPVMYGSGQTYACQIQGQWHSCTVKQLHTAVQWHSCTVTQLHTAVQWYSDTAAHSCKVTQLYSDTAAHSCTVRQLYSGTAVQWHSCTVTQLCTAVQWNSSGVAPKLLPDQWALCQVPGHRQSCLVSTASTSAAWLGGLSISACPFVAPMYFRFLQVPMLRNIIPFSTCPFLNARWWLAT